jgi:hypothetical protein
MASASSGPLSVAQMDVSESQFGSSYHPGGIDMSRMGTSSAKSPDRSLKQSISGSTFIWDANLELDIRVMSPVWACAGRGAVRHEDGLETHIGCANSCVDDAVIDAVIDAIDCSCLRATILSLRLWIMLSCFSILPHSLASMTWHNFSADLRPATSSTSSL